MKVRYRTEYRTIEVRVPIPFVLKKPGKLKPVKRRMRQYKIYEKEEKEYLIKEYYRRKENGTLTIMDMYFSAIPLREGHTTNYRCFASVPELINDWRRSK